MSTFAKNTNSKTTNIIKSQVYNEYFDYAIEVIKTVKESGYEVDYELEQFLIASTRIGATLAQADAPIDQKDLLQTYKEAEMEAAKAIYWIDVLGHLDIYNAIPFESLRKKCESVHGMILSSIKIMDKLMGR